MGVVLFIAWAIETVIWVASTVNLAADGEITPIFTALLALALMTLLAGMEGLEVAVIDRWNALYPDRSTSLLAGWLAARQLFVALIVTSATLLANRGEIIVPGTSISVEHGIVLALFDLTWTTLTVLWFAQIFPKHLAATNPDRYLKHLRAPLFPIVEVVRKVGISHPAEVVAAVVEKRLDWPLTHAEQMEEAVVPRERSVAGIWRELIPEQRGRSGAGRFQDESGRAVE